MDLERLERFRRYTAMLDPAAEPQQAIRDKLYVEPPTRSLAHQLASGLQLAPTSTHLVVGSVGAGKSTELLLAATKMRAAGDTSTIYVDVSRRHDLNKDLEGVLLVLAGLQLSRIVKDDNTHSVSAAKKSFERWADGYWFDYDPGDGDPGDELYHPGVLAPPLPLPGSVLAERIDALKALKAALPDPLRHCVILFDSLDRLSDVNQFRKVVLEDVRGLKEAGIGVVIVGPPRVVYGANRPIVDLFDQLHTQPALDVEKNAEASEFLTQVLARRTDETVLPAEPRTALVKWSGGVLRDLIGLTRNTVEEAFLMDTDRVTMEHVLRAADRFGRSRMVGLQKGELEKLQQLRRRRGILHTAGIFLPTTDEDLALLDSLRVLEYPGVTTRYAVHPTIKPLLAGLEAGK